MTTRKRNQKKNQDNSDYKIAIVFDDLIQFGGAEKLLLEILSIWPNAVLYTSVCSKEWEKKLNQLGVTYKTSFLQKLPFASTLNRLYSVFLFHVFAFQQFDFSEYKMVLSVSARYAHGIRTRPETLHICYMNSPGRMFWEPADYFDKETMLQIPFMGACLNYVLSLSLCTLRIVDYVNSQAVDKFIANSALPKKRIKKYLKRDSVIIHPFVDDVYFSEPLGASAEDYYLVISRLVSWKKIDIAVRACEALGLKLIVLGEGPDKKRLEKVAEEHTTFMGYVSQDEKIEFIKNCKAVIVTQQEDFGIVPLEALALGKPVIAFGKGGVFDSLYDPRHPNSTKYGKFFFEQTSKSLADVLGNFDAAEYEAAECRKKAKEFSRQKFVTRLKEFVDSVYLDSTSGSIP